MLLVLLLLLLLPFFTVVVIAAFPIAVAGNAVIATVVAFVIAIQNAG